MFFPIGDSPNLPKTPWMTWALIAVNVAIHVSLWPLAWQPASRGDPALVEYVEVLARERGVVPQAVSRAELVRFEHGFRPSRMSIGDAVTAMFLHAGLAHLLGNMLFLWIFGDNVEHRLGPWLFLLAYLGTGFAAAFGDALLRWGSGIPSVGASGAISGVLGFYFLWFPRNRVRVFIFLLIIIDVIELPARLVLGAYLVVENLLPLVLGGAGGGVSYGAHIGGFLAGWALAGSLGIRGGREARRRADAGGLDALGLIALGEGLAAEGDARGALGAFQRALSRYPNGPGRARAHLGAARVLLYGFGSPTAAYQHLYAAMEEDPTPAEAEAARALAEELRRSTRSLPRRGAW